MSVSVGGNLHWLTLVNDEPTMMRISCFDLETELFSTFSRPSPQPTWHHQCLSVLGDGLSVSGDRLCLCDHLRDGEFVIWTMNVYGDEKSWTRDFVFKREFGMHAFHNKGVRVFEYGDILIITEEYRPPRPWFSIKNKNVETTKKIIQIDNVHCRMPVVYMPSFLHLPRTMENVRSF